MAERKVQRSRPLSADAKAKQGARTRTKANTVPHTVDGLLAECNRLRAEVDTLRAELDDVKARRDDALNRIAWVIDSLNSLREAET